MRGPFWSEQDDHDLRRLYPDLNISREELEQQFRRSWKAIKTRARKFGLHRRSPRPLSSRPWTEAEERLLHYMLYAHKHAITLDRALNASGLGLPRKHLPSEV